MSVIISYIQIALSVIMVALILIQHSDESLGSAFGASGYLRLSYATSMDVIKEGCDRIEKFCGTL